MQGIRSHKGRHRHKGFSSGVSMQGIRVTQDVTDTKVSQALLVCKVLESHRRSQTQRFLKRCYLYPNLTVVTCASVVFVVYTLTFHSYDGCSSQRNFLSDKIEVSEKGR